MVTASKAGSKLGAKAPHVKNVKGVTGTPAQRSAAARALAKKSNKTGNPGAKAAAANRKKGK